ncbi:MAG: ISAzo13 family transposase [Flavobacteriia bacterium]|nr:ISAzo13 family transposase [Flavobacteriia bacterium]
MEQDKLLKEKLNKLLPILDERQKRIYLASESKYIGRGGLTKISKLTGVSRVTINSGISDLDTNLIENDKKKPTKRIRKEGGGRKKKTDLDDNIKKSILEIVSPHTMGNPMNPLVWTSKSLRKIATLVKERGYNVSHKLVGVILNEEGFSLQSNRKTDEGGTHVDRDAQFEFINAKVTSFLNEGNPVISVDCKKKENVGNFKNQGKEWSKKHNPKEVKVYDFIDKELGKAIPYGIYDIQNNEGFVNVGISHDTASFAVASIRKWWQEMGCYKYKDSKKLLITADGGGSNSSRSKLWKKELELFSKELNIEISVCHFPPGTSKWNKIEHRLFSYISMNWRAKPLTSLQIIIDLISSTKTEKGLIVKAKLDEQNYLKGIGGF